MHKENILLKSHRPSVEEVNEYVLKWNDLEDYVNQERALDKYLWQLGKEAFNKYK